MQSQRAPNRLPNGARTAGAPDEVWRHFMAIEAGDLVRALRAVRSGLKGKPGDPRLLVRLAQGRHGFSVSSGHGPIALSIPVGTSRRAEVIQASVCGKAMKRAARRFPKQARIHLASDGEHLCVAFGRLRADPVPVTPTCALLPLAGDEARQFWQGPVTEHRCLDEAAAEIRGSGWDADHPAESLPRSMRLTPTGFTISGKKLGLCLRHAAPDGANGPLDYGGDLPASMRLVVDLVAAYAASQRHVLVSALRGPELYVRYQFGALRLTVQVTGVAGIQMDDFDDADSGYDPD